MPIPRTNGHAVDTAMSIYARSDCRLLDANCCGPPGEFRERTGMAASSSRCITGRSSYGYRAGFRSRPVIVPVANTSPLAVVRDDRAKCKQERTLGNGLLESSKGEAESGAVAGGLVLQSAVGDVLRAIDVGRTGPPVRVEGRVGGVRRAGPR